MRLKDVLRCGLFMLQVSMAKGKVSKKLQRLEQEKKLKKQLQEAHESRLQRIQAQNVVKEMAVKRPILFGSYLATECFFSNLKQFVDRIYPKPKDTETWTSGQLYRCMGLNLFDSFTWIISFIFEQYFLFELIKDLHEKEIILELLSKEPNFYEKNNKLRIGRAVNIPEDAANLAKDYISFVDKVMYFIFSVFMRVTHPNFARLDIFHGILLICAGSLPVIARRFVPWLNPHREHNFVELLENRLLVEISGTKEQEAKTLKEQILRSEYGQRVNQIIGRALNVTPYVLTIPYYVYWFVEWPKGNIDATQWKKCIDKFDALNGIMRFLTQARSLSELISNLNSNEERLGSKLELLHAERKPDTDAPAYCPSCCRNKEAQIKIELTKPFIR